MSADAEPNQTLFLKNLNGRIHIDELKIALYGLFTTYGKILAIQATRSEKMREQAFVVFDDIAAATAALKALNNTPLYDRPMKIQYAKTKSDPIAMREGTFIARLPGEKNKNQPGKRGIIEDSNKPAKQIKSGESEEPVQTEEDDKTMAE